MATQANKKKSPSQSPRKTATTSSARRRSSGGTGGAAPAGGGNTGAGGQARGLRTDSTSSMRSMPPGGVAAAPTLSTSNPNAQMPAHQAMPVASAPTTSNKLSSQQQSGSSNESAPGQSRAQASAVSQVPMASRGQPTTLKLGPRPECTSSVSSNQRPPMPARPARPIRHPEQPAPMLNDQNHHHQNQPDCCDNDDMECSCSNSIDCLSDDQSASSQLVQPLLSSPPYQRPHPPPPLPLTAHQHQHQHQHHHKLNSGHSQQVHHSHQYVNQRSAHYSSQHLIQRDQPTVDRRHHRGRDYYAALTLDSPYGVDGLDANGNKPLHNDSHFEGAELSGAAHLGPPQSAPATIPVRDNFHLPPSSTSPQRHVVPPMQHQPAQVVSAPHRPLLTLSSMPPIPIAGAPHPQQTHPPPLVRYSTYTASSDTITDNNLLISGTQQRVETLHQIQHPAGESQRVDQYYTSEHQEVKDGCIRAPYSNERTFRGTIPNASSSCTDQMFGKQCRPSNREANGTGGGCGQVIHSNKGRSHSPTQHARTVSSKSRSEAANSSGPAARWGSPDHRRRLEGGGGKQRHTQRDKPLGFGESNGVEHSDSVQTRQPLSLMKRANPSPQKLSGTWRQMEGALISRPSGAGAITMAGGPLNENIGGLAAAAYSPSIHSPIPPLPANFRAPSAISGNSQNLFASVSPFEQAAFCPPAPIVSSHRTNSPWMRVSSIILTPIGLVIVMFIVISPLLHYLLTKKI